MSVLFIRVMGLKDALKSKLLKNDEEEGNSEEGSDEVPN